eukprot:scaffold2552_cov167-Isochrysis_galbana.AAC.1
MSKTPRLASTRKDAHIARRETHAQQTADSSGNARQTSSHTAQPNWGVAPAWPTRHLQKKKLQTHGGRPFREECALNPNSAWPKPFTSWDLQEAFNDILRSYIYTDNLEVTAAATNTSLRTGWLMIDALRLGAGGGFDPAELRPKGSGRAHTGGNGALLWPRLRPATATGSSRRGSGRCRRGRLRRRSERRGGLRRRSERRGGHARALRLLVGRVVAH